MYQLVTKELRKCSNCDYYDDETSECRANPPIVRELPTGMFKAIWPSVIADKWCGHFRMRANTYG